MCEVAIGKTPPRKETQWFSEDENDVKWISIKDLGNSGMNIFKTSEYLTEEAIKKFNVKKISKNTILLSFKLTIGRIAITTEIMTTNEAIAHFNIKKTNQMSTEFLYYYLKNFNYKSLGSTSSIAKALNSKIVKKIPVSVPDEESLRLFSKYMKSIFEMIKKNELEIIKLEKTRDILLPKLMSGEIDVSKVKISTSI